MCPKSGFSINVLDTSILFYLKRSNGVKSRPSTLAGGASLTLTLLSPSKSKDYYSTTSLYYNDWLVCRFDSTTVVQGGHITNYDPRASSGPTVTFLVPPFTGGSKEVDLELSADGILFRKFGTLVYHGENRFDFALIHAIVASQDVPAAFADTGSLWTRKCGSSARNSGRS